MSHWNLSSLLLLLTALAALSGCYDHPCVDDGDCLPGFECVGSSVCPPDVDCLVVTTVSGSESIWEGEPGVCQPIAERLCRRTGGEWDVESCGDYHCGNAPECSAVIPGCDCGPNANYVEGEGCVPDRACMDECQEDRDCPDDFVCKRKADCPEDDRMMRPCYLEPWGVCEPGPATLCEESGGYWDEVACGHYQCGNPNLCKALIPGCDCGPEANFVEGEGCVPDRRCDEASCDDDRDCPEGYDCVGSSVCPPDVVCVWEGEPGVCKPSEERLCEDTGGYWDESACGHHPCGPGPYAICLAIIPGCDCGEEAVFVEGEGCVKKRYCARLCLGDDECDEGELCGARLVCKEPRTQDLEGEGPLTCELMPVWGGGAGVCRNEVEELCDRTGGFLDYATCFNLAGCEIEPVCSCGPDRIYVDGKGCRPLD
jgi:hypothetical protein